MIIISNVSNSIINNIRLWYLVLEFDVYDLEDYSMYLVINVYIYWYSLFERTYIFLLIISYPLSYY